MVENVLPLVLVLAFALIIWLVYRWVHSWSSTAKEWVFIALAFLCSAGAYAEGKRARWVLTVAVVSGLLLAVGAGYLVVSGGWRFTVALVAKMVRDVRKRIEEDKRNESSV
jgi:hypothetical protein